MTFKNRAVAADTQRFLEVVAGRGCAYVATAVTPLSARRCTRHSTYALAAGTSPATVFVAPRSLESRRNKKLWEAQRSQSAPAPPTRPAEHLSPIPRLLAPPCLEGPGPVPRNPAQRGRRHFAAAAGRRRILLHPHSPTALHSPTCAPEHSGRPAAIAAAAPPPATAATSLAAATPPVRAARAEPCRRHPGRFRRVSGS